MNAVLGQGLMMSNAVTFGKDRYHLNGAMEQWCRETIGDGGWGGMDGEFWYVKSMFGNTTFTFRDPKHLTLFVLRWA
jgi:hypothetical protein